MALAPAEYCAATARSIKLAARKGLPTVMVNACRVCYALCHRSEKGADNYSRTCFGKCGVVLRAAVFSPSHARLLAPDVVVAMVIALYALVPTVPLTRGQSAIVSSILNVAGARQCFAALLGRARADANSDLAVAVLRLLHALFVAASTRLRKKLGLVQPAIDTLYAFIACGDVVTAALTYIVRAIALSDPDDWVEPFAGSSEDSMLGTLIAVQALHRTDTTVGDIVAAAFLARYPCLAPVDALIALEAAPGLTRRASTSAVGARHCLVLRPRGQAGAAGAAGGQ